MSDTARRRFQGGSRRGLVVGMILVAAGLGASVWALVARNAEAEHDHSTHDHSVITAAGGHGDGGAHLDHGGTIVGASATVQGVTLSVLDAPTPNSDTLRFRLERDGGAVTEFTENHGAMLHLLAIRNDLAEFQHVHPEMGDDGIWTVELPLRSPGSYRIVTDIKPVGFDAPISPAVDVVIEGIGPREPLAAPNDELLVDGLAVVRDGFSFAVAPPDDLEPYLGQPAHLVGFREGDLAYVHLHALSGDGGVFEFAAPGEGSSGSWRFFLQFGNDGAVVTAPFTVTLA